MRLSVFSPEHPDNALIERAIAGDQAAAAEVVARGHWLLVSPAVKASGPRKAVVIGRENAPQAIGQIERFLTGGGTEG